MTRSLKLSRRTLLRGTGVAIALPWLEAMSNRHASAASSQGPPLRLAFFYVPNGVNMDDWRVGDAGPLGELSPILKPLEPIKQHVSVLTGMAAEHCDGKSAAHEPAGGGYLVGKKCKHSEEPEVGGASVDQIVARKIGYQTPIDSLALGIDPGHRGDHGYSGTYMSHISWRDKQTPAALELNPKQLYDRLFQGKAPKRPNWNAAEKESAPVDDSIEASVLDLVSEEAKSLQRQLGFNDRRKLEAYLDGLRGIEKRIAVANRDSHSHHQDSFTNDRHLQDDDPEIAKLIIPAGKGIPSVYADHVNLMLDIMTIAFQTDTTRVASFIFSHEKSGRSYPEIDAKGSHHSTSHHQKKPENLQQLTNINRHHIELFSRMIQRMSEIKEGDGSLLDNVMLCYGSGISDGNKHNNDDLPLLLAGGGGGTIRGGQHRVYADRTPLCNLYVEMLSRMGLSRESFGNSNGGLDDLTS
ncbi:hypothetical protein Pla52o_29370 [Novipirellula galeiformis]|uniref:DUF1552 domain-containing protein n=1 Tax=Novipirellula galeiformis TaxID=2528004 RepID=A0A5C6CJ39_9BACT|nr:DUF1552 domain-containing protein [Novipirellula galeiformis]TWU23401.1 hypothetical protein Pla52o_29370 [Novipirellula galeiformis]